MLNRTSLTDRRKYFSSFTGINIFLVATQRTGLPNSETIGLGMLLVVLPNETNVRCYSDLHYTKLQCQWLDYSLTPVLHLTTTSSPTTIRFGNSHNIPNTWRVARYNITLDDRCTTLAWESLHFLPSDRNTIQNCLIKTEKFSVQNWKWIHTNGVMEMCEMLRKKATCSIGWKLCISCSINVKIYWF